MRNQPRVLLILGLLVVALVLAFNRPIYSAVAGWASLDAGTKKIVPYQQNDGSLRAGSGVNMSKLTGTGTGTKTSTWTATATTSALNNTDTGTISVTAGGGSTSTQTVTLIDADATTSTAAVPGTWNHASSAWVTSTLTNYATTGALAGYATTATLTNYATTATLTNYATTATLTNYVSTSTLTNYATTATLSNYATTATLSNYALSTVTSATVGIGPEGYLTAGDSTITASSVAIGNNPVIHLTSVPAGVVIWPTMRQYLSARAYSLTGVSTPFPEPFYDNFVQHTSSQVPLGIQSGNVSFVLVQNAPGLMRCSMPGVANQSCMNQVGSVVGLIAATPATQAWYAAVRMSFVGPVATSYGVLQVTDGTRSVTIGHYGAQSTTYWGGGAYHTSWSWTSSSVAVDSTTHLFEMYSTGTATAHFLVDGTEFATATIPEASSWGTIKYVRMYSSNGAGGTVATFNVYGWGLWAANGTL